ncbi:MULTISPECIES: hypothetical protein [unclassified Microbacterium]|uniref:hypothetical protein n=1 Tax=unclassified Microbacterium TaxID=2609290 RepID=UPI001FCEDBCD|nr:MULTISPECIES: hypothetical protein [unclassified Microbacterium]
MERDRRRCRGCRGSSGPLALVDGVPSVRWSAAGGYMPLEAYLRERVALLRGSADS